MNNKIAEYRELKGLSQEELAAMANISRPYLSDIETGKILNPGLKISFRLAKALNCQVDDIFFEIVVNHELQERNI